MIKFMKNDALDMLKGDIKNNIDKYQLDECWIDEYFKLKNFEKYYFDTGINIDNLNLPELSIGNSYTDSENARKLYTALKFLSPIQASDLRLWAYLEHKTYWNYMRKRWPIENVKKSKTDDSEEEIMKKKENKIRDRYFYKTKPYARNALARLWWGAYITYDVKNKNDPFEYTDYIFSNQDLFSQSTEHALGRNKTIFIAALKELKTHENINRDQFRYFFSTLNQIGGIIVFDSLNEEKALELVKKAADKTIIK